MNSVTLVLPYYINKGMLREQYRVLRELPARIRDEVRVVVVDDGSPVDPAWSEDIGVSLQVYRVGVDVRWNQDACRNIGVHHAETEWLLLTDIDHVPPLLTWERLTKRKYDPKIIYAFSRVSAPEMTSYKPHPNSWFMTRTMYERIGGYDERYAGFYGTDAMFRDRARDAAPIIRLKEVLVRYPREVIPDASTTQYLRKQPEDREEIPKIRAQIAALPVQEQAPVRFRFPYHRVA